MFACSLRVELGPLHHGLRKRRLGATWEGDDHPKTLVSVYFVSPSSSLAGFGVPWAPEKPSIAFDCLRLRKSWKKRILRNVFTGVSNRRICTAVFGQSGASSSGASGLMPLKIPEYYNNTR